MGVLTLVLLGGSGRFLIQRILYWISHIEKPLEGYPYWRARVFNPIRCLQAYLDNPIKVKSFIMTSDNAFVLNMDHSTQRMKHFQQWNPEGIVQRFSAHTWTGVTNMEKYWQDHYPFLKRSVQKGDYGDAGCSFSHLVLWQEKLLDTNQEYLFVFEDDAKLLEPLQRVHGSSHPTIQGPDTADIIFLAAPALKRVNVFWKDASEPAVRVVGGYGTWGYIITRAGALKMTESLRSSHDPLDLSLFASSAIKVYLPLASQWPAVEHQKTPSTRLGLNKKK